MLKAILAIDTCYGLGYKNELLYTSREDLHWFKMLTSYKTVLMGRETWDYLPEKPLVDRSNIVLSKTLTTPSEYRNLLFIIYRLFVLHGKNV